MQPLPQTFGTALLALTELAGDGEDRPWRTVEDIKRRTGLPGPYLQKVFQALNRSGWIEAKRGYRGGYRLVAHAEDIDLLSLARRVDPSIDERRCLLSTGECTDERSCPLHEFWKSTRERIDRELASTTIADAAAFEQRKRRRGARSKARTKRSTRKKPRSSRGGDK